MSNTQLHEELGKHFTGRFKIVKLLGQGGMASVYRIQSEKYQNKYFALKVLHSHLTEKQESVERFLAEARSTQKLKGVDNCIQIFESGKIGRVPYFIMEEIEGWDLDQELNNRGALPLPEIKRLFYQICECISAAHEMGIIHRDIKPANVLIEKETRRAVVTDFGIARVAYEAGLTQPGTVFGTPPYMAPEQVAPQPGQTVDYRTDIYALGMMLYQMCTGGLPYSGEGIALATAYQNPQNFVPPRKLRHDIPPEVERVIVQSLSVNPAHRYSTATALARAFKEALDIPTPSGGTEVQPPSPKTYVWNGKSSGPSVPPPSGTTENGANKSSRNLLLLGGIGGALLILGVVLVLIIYFSLDKNTSGNVEKPDPHTVSRTTSPTPSPTRTTSPAPTPAPAPSPAITRTEVVDFMNRWANAWERMYYNTNLQTKDNYWRLYDARDFYSPYREQGQRKFDGFTAWRNGNADRARCLGVELSNMNIEITGNQAVVRYTQTFYSDRYGDVAQKILTLRKENGNIQIIEENQIDYYTTSRRCRP